MSDAQLREYQEKFLLNVALRTITRSFGAGLLNFHSKQAEPMEVTMTEKICLHGKISPSNMNLEYPVQEQAPAKLVRALFILINKLIHRLICTYNRVAIRLYPQLQPVSTKISNLCRIQPGRSRRMCPF
jgi:hypothetical protein